VLGYKNNVDNASRRETASRQNVDELKVRVQKLQTIAQSAKKNAALVANMLKRKKAARAGGRAAELERSSTRVKDTIAALRKVADSRRDHMNEKKSSSATSSWVQSFPGMPNALKKSLWHRMHRRKQQIVLRPTEESIMNELRTKVAETISASQQQIGGRSSSRKRVAMEEELRKAEQLFLLAMHPFSEGHLPTVPVTKSGDHWAEPGWHLVLDVPGDSLEESRILPCRPRFPVLEKNLSEIASAPGRQAASLLRTSHFRCLSSPLSAFAVASSPAETVASVPTSSECRMCPVHLCFCVLKSESMFKFCVSIASVQKPYRRGIRSTFQMKPCPLDTRSL